MVQRKFGEFGPATGLSRLGLQWWAPTKRGEVIKEVKFGAPTDAEIEWYVKWGKANKVEILLCVYNGTSGWDWTLSRAAFDANRSTFAKNLVRTVMKYELDGIDLDLEGGKRKDAERDRAAFKKFLQELSAELKSRKKTLTIATYCNPVYNTPGPPWWKEMAGLVDCVNVMGYAKLYEGSTKKVWSVQGYPMRYSWLQHYGLKAGLKADQIALGFPSHVADWGTGGRGTNVLDHLAECRIDCEVPASIAIWDIQLKGNKGKTHWQSASVWKELTRIAGTSANRKSKDQR